MRRTPLRLATVFLLIFAADAHAQTRTDAAPARDARRAATRSEAPTTADEEFELNIPLRRISEAEFRASTSISTEGASGLRLNVGVALSANDIEVLLRNVRGRVRFRATLAPVLRLLDARRDATPRDDAPTATPP